MVKIFRYFSKIRGGSPLWTDDTPASIVLNSEFFEFPINVDTSVGVLSVDGFAPTVNISSGGGSGIIGYNNGTKQSGWGTGNAYHAVKYTAIENGTATTINVNLRSDDGSAHDYYLALYEYDSGLNEWNIIDSAKTVNGGAGGSPTTLSSVISASLVNGTKYLIICKATTHAYQYVWAGDGSGPEEGAEDSSFSPGSTFPSNFSDTALASNTGYTYDLWVEYTTSGGGGGTTVSTDVGSLVLTGFAPTINITNNQNVLSGVGALTINGFASIIDLKINTDFGQLTLNGFAPSINISVVASSQTGQLIATGFSPSVVATANITLNTGLGQLTLNGFAPTATPSNNIRVSANLGQLTLNGFSPTVNISQSAVTETGQLLLNGFEPSIVTTDNKIVNSGLGQILVNGFEPSPIVNTSVVTSAGELLLSGFEPSIDVVANTFVYPSFGKLIINGFRPRLRITDNTNLIQPDTINSSVINGDTLNSSVIGQNINGSSVIKANPSLLDSVITRNSNNDSVIYI